MVAFAVISTVPNSELAERVSSTYPNMSLILSGNAWLVADSLKTTQEVCEKLSIMQGGFSNVIVLRIESYFGFADPTIWEWLKVKGAGP